MAGHVQGIVQLIEHGLVLRIAFVRPVQGGYQHTVIMQIKRDVTTAKIVDIETAFLHGDLDVEQYMECPKGLKAKEEEALLLMQAIYGLTQSARQFWKKICEILIKIGFKKNQIDPCVLVKNVSERIVIVGLYVDDLLCIGANADIDQMINDLNKEGFKVKVENNLKDYLSCEIRLNKERTKGWIGQPHLIKRLEETFGTLSENLQVTVLQHSL